MEGKTCESCRWLDKWTMQVDGKFKCRVGMFLVSPDNGACEYYKETLLNDRLSDSLEEIRE